MVHLPKKILSGIGLVPPNTISGTTGIPLMERKSRVCPGWGSRSWAGASGLHCCFKVRVVDGQGMSLGVEHPILQGQHIIFTEQKIEVLESLCEEEALLHVVVGGGGGVNIPDAREPSFHPAVLLQGLGEEQRPQQHTAVGSNSSITLSCVPSQFTNPTPGFLQPLSLTEGRGGYSRLWEPGWL